MNADPPVLRTSVPKQIADRISQNIDREWKAGTQLPPEREIAERYGVSVGAVRQALAMLVARGLVIKHQGKGTIVVGKSEPAQVVAHTSGDPWDQLTATGPSAPRRETAGPRLALLFSIPDGSPLYILDQPARHQAGYPVLTRRILPNRVIAESTAKAHPDPFTDRATLVRFLTKQYGPLHQTERIRPLIPDPDVHDALGLRPGALALETVRITRDSNDRALMAESERFADTIEPEYQL